MENNIDFREAFAAWLKSRDMKKPFIDMDLSYLEAISSFLTDNHLAAADIFRENDPSLIRQIQGLLRLDKDFTRMDRQKNGHLTRVLKKYEEFCSQGASGPEFEWMKFDLFGEEAPSAEKTVPVKQPGIERKAEEKPAPEPAPDIKTAEPGKEISAEIPDKTGEEIREEIEEEAGEEILPEIPEEPEKESEPEPGTMEIVLGTRVEEKDTLVWRPNDTNQNFHTNVGVIGTMGTGKTQFTKSLITQICRQAGNNFYGRIPGILIFDYKGDYNETKEDFVRETGARVLKPYHLPYNPLALTQSPVFKPLLPVHTANAFKDTLSKAYRLGAKQQNAFFKCIMEAYKLCGIDPNRQETWTRTPPTFDMVYQIYMRKETIQKGDSLAAAMEKLASFQIFEGDPRKTRSLYEMIDGVLVVDLSGYDSDIQALVVAITLDQFYVQMQASGSSRIKGPYRELTKMILVDEADNFMSEGYTSLKKILKEGREFGVGTILSTQFLNHFGAGEDDYSKYILTWIVHNVADLKKTDIQFVFHTPPKSETEERLFTEIKNLKKHHSIIKIGNEKPEHIHDLSFWQICQEK